MILNKWVTGVGKDMFGMMTIYVIQVNLTWETSMRELEQGENSTA